MFSGAVRAVFRKKKGFGFVKILHWLLLVLFSAAAALARLRLLAVGFDADGLPVPMDLNTMVLPAVLVVAAVIAVIMARRYPAQRELCGSMDLYFAFDRSTLAVLLMVLGSFALIGSAVCSLVFSLRTTLTMILSVFLAVGAACLLYATTALRRKAEFSGVALLVPVCAMVLALILFYREHATDPILRHYYVETLALAALTVLLLEFAAFAFRGGAPRLLMPASTMSVILCAAAPWPRARRLPRSSSTPAARASRSVSARRRTSIRDAILHQNITKKDAPRRPFSYKMEDWMKRSYCLLQELR